MLALRSLSRSAPRAARISTRAVRPQPSLFRQAAAFQQSWAPVTPRLAASFHTSVIRRQDGNVNDELVAKLQSEISLEEDMREDEDLSLNIKEYLESSPFQLEDKPGQQEVVLSRTYGDEKIRVTFSIADLNQDIVEDNEEDNAMYDDVDEIAAAQSGGASTKGSINQGNKGDGNFRVAPEDRVAPADREELDDEYDEEAGQGFPSRANIRIERPGKGALAIEATIQDGDIIIEDVAHFSDSNLAEPKTAEQSWSRQALYTGPHFNQLDEDLQILLEKYIEDRGVNTRMALFIPDYIDHKEQKEYIRWLKNLKSFVE